MVGLAGTAVGNVTGEWLVVTVASFAVVGWAIAWMAVWIARSNQARVRDALLTPWRERRGERA